jgi:hypothetical protein
MVAKLRRGSLPVDGAKRDLPCGHNAVASPFGGELSPFSVDMYVGSSRLLIEHAPFVPRRIGLTPRLVW